MQQKKAKPKGFGIKKTFKKAKSALMGFSLPKVLTAEGWKRKKKRKTK
jgi:hypothetical protein